jgi:hypothetical protein
MTESLPQVRHRGFLPGGDPADQDAADYESAEGVLIRVRLRPRASRVVRRTVVAAVSGRGAMVAIKSATVTGPRRPLRTRR